MEHPPQDPFVSPRLRIFHELQSLFSTYPGQSCLYVPAHNRNEWMMLIPSGKRHQLHDFERYFEKIALRDAYVQDNFTRVFRDRKARRDRFGGCVDFFAPVIRNGICEGFLISGAFREKPWTAVELSQRWKEISGGEGSDLNPDFVRYVTVALDMPILDVVGMDGYARTLDLMARWLAGDEDDAMLAEIGRLRREIFAPRFFHLYWAEWTLGLDKFFAREEKNRELAVWEKDEMGITLPPNVVLAIMPYSGGKSSGLVEDLCRARDFQWEAFHLARRFGDAVAAPLGDYGAVVLASVKATRGTAQGRLEAREKAQAFRKELEKRFGVTVLAGVGSVQKENHNLARSYREAVAALHMAIETGQNPSFVESTVGEREGVPIAGLRASMRELADAMSLVSKGRLAIAREKFVRQVLFASHGQSENVKIHFLSALQVLLERFEARSSVTRADARKLGDDLADRVASARNLPELIAVFAGTLGALERYQEKPREAGSIARVEEVIKAIEDEPGKPWKLSAFCRRTGLSAPTFLKRFKKVTGMGFGPFLRKVRLQKARQMLQEGTLTLERIAQDCGFNSASYLIQVFNKTMGTSPRKYRKATSKI
jgi:AraC-like DNA-binding protein